MKNRLCAVIADKGDPVGGTIAALEEIVTD